MKHNDVKYSYIMIVYVTNIIKLLNMISIMLFICNIVANKYIPGIFLNKDFKYVIYHGCIHI